MHCAVYIFKKKWVNNEHFFYQFAALWTLQRLKLNILKHVILPFLFKIWAQKFFFSFFVLIFVGVLCSIAIIAGFILGVCLCCKKHSVNPNQGVNVTVIGTDTRTIVTSGMWKKYSIKHLHTHQFIGYLFYWNFYTCFIFVKCYRHHSPRTASHGTISTRLKRRICNTDFRCHWTIEIII